MNAQRIVWLSAGDPPDTFPDLSNAIPEPDGLLAAGGDLTSQRLLAAYRRGIFPWYEQGQPILWWSPDPRCVIYPGDLRVSRRLQQYGRRSRLVLRFNHSFADVIRACAGKRRFEQGTWLTQDMIEAYETLHAQGWAHSIEMWQEDQLVGGLYGLCIGRVFFGESMFSAVDNASKFALVGLASQLLVKGIELIDCQVTSQHLLTLGATIIPRADFAENLRKLCRDEIPSLDWPVRPLPVADVFDDWRTAALQ